jgi:hypothetical protein
MVALCFFVLRLLVSPFGPISRLEAENAALRRQLIVLQRQVRGRVQFTNSDRLFFLQLYRWFPSIVEVMTTIRPEALVRWHRAGPTMGSPCSSVELVSLSHLRCRK